MFKNNDKTKGVVFVEPTPNQELLNFLKEAERRRKISNNMIIKFIEKSGTKIIDFLRRNDPFRINCPPGSECRPCVSSTGYSSFRKQTLGTLCDVKFVKIMKVNHAEICTFVAKNIFNSWRIRTRTVFYSNMWRRMTRKTKKMLSLKW